jgi:formamidopyrimidine-DNA glycosylase
MPELPEVETIVSELNKTILNKTITNISLTTPSIVHSKEPPLIILKNNKFTNISRHGKYIKLLTNTNNKIVVHLRMTGKILLVRHNTPATKHDHLHIDFIDDSRLTYNDIRKFGKWIFAPKDKNFDDYINAGTDAMNITTEELLSLINKHPNKKLKTFLLDQTLVAGIGNIYADEICFDLKKHPESILKTIQAKSLHTSINKILSVAIKNKGTTFSDYRTTNNTKGTNQNNLTTYKQTTCKTCKTPINRIKTAGRTTHFCPMCQK